MNFLTDAAVINSYVSEGKLTFVEFKTNCLVMMAVVGAAVR